MVKARTRHPPAVYGSGAAVVVVRPQETCCSKKPFSNHGRSRRPWTDILPGYLPFCLGLTAASAAARRGCGAAGEGSFCRCKVDICAGPQSPKGSAGPRIILRRHSQSVIRRDLGENSDSSRLAKPNRALPPFRGCSRCVAVLPASVCVCGEEV